MIVTRFGGEVVIISRHGTHKASYMNVPDQLLLVHIYGKATYRWAHQLRADGGVKEIDAAINAAPFVGMPSDALKKAMRMAQ
jgi:hypothetical protein